MKQHIDITELHKIAPFPDSEINTALRRMTEAKEFEVISKFVFPTSNIEDVKKILHDIHSADDFQKKFMHKAVRRVVEESAKELTFDGFDKLDKNKAYLFIANHRDIVLDSAILQVLMVEHDLPTTEITFGNNLMISPFIIDFAKVNKMFVVYREGTKIERLRNSMLLSAYIRHAINEKKRSVWIAQRNGRTKDGNDKTQEALLKMLNLSGDNDIVDNFKSLNIVPLTISYEYESCDILKALELYLSKKETYIKKPGEDFKSIITGFLQYKGRIHLSAAQPLTYEFCENVNENTVFFEKMTSHLDSIFHKNYKLYPNNFIAYDLLNKCSKHKNMYSDNDKNNFISYYENKIKETNITDIHLNETFLKIYANPVINKNL